MRCTSSYESVLNLAHRQATLVARSIHALKLPSYQPCISAAAAEELMRKLFEAFELRADSVLQALNTIQHDRCERLAWRLVIKDNPATSEPFSKHVLPLPRGGLSTAARGSLVSGVPFQPAVGCAACDPRRRACPQHALAQRPAAMPPDRRPK